MKDAEYVTEIVAIRRVFHRDLIARISQIADLERKWSCKISFPSTELASDKVTVHGPEWQVPHAINELLVS